MKKTVILLLALAAAALKTNAQDPKFYLKAGFNLANVSYNKDGEVNNANALPSFHAGFMADLPILPVLSIQPGIQFSGKGSKLKWASGSYSAESKFNPGYVEVPVNVVVNLPLIDKESKVFFGAGGYAAMGVSGKRSIEVNALGVLYKREDKIKFSNDDPTTGNEEDAGYGKLKRFDYGLNATAGFAFHNLLIAVNYGLGLAKIYSGTENGADDKSKNRVLSLSVGVSL
ncbi:MAG: outer membrane beta-barrel protein [Flavihumibacter sp.]